MSSSKDDDDQQKSILRMAVSFVKGNFLTLSLSGMVIALGLALYQKNNQKFTEDEDEIDLLDYKGANRRVRSKNAFIGAKVRVKNQYSPHDRKQTNKATNKNSMQGTVVHRSMQQQYVVVQWADGLETVHMDKPKPPFPLALLPPGFPRPPPPMKLVFWFSGDDKEQEQLAKQNTSKYETLMQENTLRIHGPKRIEGELIFLPATADTVHHKDRTPSTTTSYDDEAHKTADELKREKLLQKENISEYFKEQIKSKGVWFHPRTGLYMYAEELLHQKNKKTQKWIIGMENVGTPCMAMRVVSNDNEDKSEDVVNLTGEWYSHLFPALDNRVRIEKVHENHRPFTDFEFPPLWRSIGDPRYKSLKWIRAREIAPGARLVKDGIDPTDIVQGAQGTCYVLAALSALATQPESLKYILQSEKTNKDGRYEFKMCLDGTWQTIVIDDWLPISANMVRGEKKELIFCKSESGAELWPSLLEKAWAKYCGDYEASEGGNTAFVLRAFTGCPIQHIMTHDEELTDKILLAKKNNWLMATSGVQSRTIAKEIVTTFAGLVHQHAYAILDVVTIDNRLWAKLRNPWGKGTFWHSEEKNQNDDIIRPVLTKEENENGVFWIDVVELRRWFTQVVICQYRNLNEWKYSSTKVKFSLKHLGKLRATHRKIDRHVHPVFGEFEVTDDECEEAIVCLQQPYRKAMITSSWNHLKFRMTIWGGDHASVEDEIIECVNKAKDVNNILALASCMVFAETAGNDQASTMFGWQQTLTVKLQDLKKGKYTICVEPLAADLKGDSVAHLQKALKQWVNDEVPLCLSVLGKGAEIPIRAVAVTDKLKREIWKHSTKKLLNRNKEYMEGMKEWISNERIAIALDINVDGIGSAVKGNFKAYGFEGYKKDWSNTYIMFNCINGHPAFFAFDVKKKDFSYTDSGYVRCLFFDAVNHRWCLELTDQPFLRGIPMLCLPTKKTKYKAHAKKLAPSKKKPSRD